MVRRICVVYPKCLLSLLLLLLTAFVAQGQTDRVSVTGIVQDASEARIPNAGVKLISMDTGTQTDSTTGEDGSFAFSGVMPGRYTLQIERDGFDTTQISGITLNVGDHKDMVIRMKVGSTTQTVTVDGAGLTINTNNATVSTVVDRQFVENLPLNGRSFQSLIALTPGVVIAQTSPGSEQGQFSVAGQRAGSNYFTVDGVSANFAASSGIFESQTTNGGLPAFSALGSTTSLVSLDALQEFRIQTSTYAPEFGRENGGQVMLVTRSGTNRFHGTVFEYFRNDVLDANDWFADSTGLSKPRERQNDFGGVLGGPILKDKTFFFLSYEGLRAVQPAIAISDVPSLAARQNAPAGVQALLNAFPLPNGPSTGPDQSQIAVDGSNQSTLDATSIRIDHTINSKLTLFARYNHSPSWVEEDIPPGPADPSKQTQGIDTGTAGLTAILSPTITNEFRFNYSRARGTDKCYAAAADGAVVPASSLILAPWQNAITGWSFPEILSGRNMFICDGPLADNLNHQLNVVDTVELVRGTQVMKFGFDYRRLTPAEGHPQTGIFYEWLNVPELVSGAPADVVAAYQDPKNLSLRFHNFSAFAQDTWKATPRFTLTYGLRWDYNPAPAVTSGNPPYALSQITNLATATLLSPGAPLWHADWKNFAPRIGASYVLHQSANRPTILRAGFGQFFDLGTSAGGTLDDGQGFFPYSLVTYLCNFGTGTACSGSIPYTGPQPPFVFTQPYQGIMRAFDPRLKLPYALEWSIAIEQALSTNQTFKVTYLGSAGRNQLRDNVIANPNPILSAMMLSTNSGYSNYNALQLQFERRLSHGLQALLSYTWAHSLDLNSADVSSPWGGTSVGVPSNLYNIHQDYGNSDFDIRHSFSAALTYNVPTPRFSNALARAVLRDWSIDSINSARSGTSFNVLYQPATPGAFTGPTGPFDLRPDEVAGQPVWIHDANAPGGKKLNVAAFAIPAALGQGSEGRNSIRGFPLVEMDVAIRRQFNVTEGLNLQFRAEGFNFINHPNFGNPLNNMGTCPLGAQCSPVYGWGLSQAMMNQTLGANNTSYASPFGSLYQLGGPRSFQLSLKLQF